MRLRKLHLGAALLFLTGLPLVQAHPDDPTGSGPDGAVVGGSVSVKLTPQEMTAKSEQMLADMEGSQRRVTELQLLARNAKDIIKLNCVNDKLLQVKQLLNIADDAKAMVYTAGDEREHAFAQITISSEKVAALRGEAEGCVGDGEIFVGATKNYVSRPRVLDDPTTADPFAITGFSIERPTYATPFL